jgi:hypothetical protein
VPPWGVICLFRCIQIVNRWLRYKINAPLTFLKNLRPCLQTLVDACGVVYLYIQICIKDRKNIWFLTLQDNLKDWWQSFVLHVYFFFEYKREVSNHLGSYLWEKKIPRLRKWWTGLPVIFSILWISSSSTFELPNLSKIKSYCMSWFLK